MIAVYDDIIDRDTSEEIKELLLSNTFRWNFTQDLTDTNDPQKAYRPGLFNTFVVDGEIVIDPGIFHLLNKIVIGAMDIQSLADHEWLLLKLRSFLQFPLAEVGGLRDPAHIDYMPMKHLSFVYYPIDAEGDTIIYSNKYSPENPEQPYDRDLIVNASVRPKQGRIVIFDGYHWHTGTQPKRGLRCVMSGVLVKTNG